MVTCCRVYPSIVPFSPILVPTGPGSLLVIMHYFLFFSHGCLDCSQPLVKTRPIRHSPWKIWRHVYMILGSPEGSDSKDSTCGARDTGWIPGLERALEEGNGNPFQYSWLENSMDRGDWWALILITTCLEKSPWFLNFATNNFSQNGSYKNYYNFVSYVY